MDYGEQHEIAPVRESPGHPPALHQLPSPGQLAENVCLGPPARQRIYIQVPAFGHIFPEQHLLLGHDLPGEDVDAVVSVEWPGEV